MSWVADSKLSWPQRFAVNVMRCGPIPRHVAFIMDGNRRFATKSALPNRTDGHRLGFDKLAEALQWCLELGIAEATVYAFSIENFKRSDDEVDTLMRLAREKFDQLLGDLERLHQTGVCVRIVGNWSLLPLDLQQTMARAVLRTAHNRRAVLNVAFAYTSRDEATEALRTLADGANGRTGSWGDAAVAPLHETDLTDDLLRQCMYTRRSAEPELLVRTSGESRLSDFMLFQITSTIVYFTDTLWPEFSIWHLLSAIFYYQTQHARIVRVRSAIATAAAEGDGSVKRSARAEAFLRRFEEREQLRLMALSADA